MNSGQIELRGTKIIEVPYFAERLTNPTGSILIVGERHGGTEGVSETILSMGFSDVATTDILPTNPDSWLRTNTNWKHIQSDFIEFDESTKYDAIVAISVFEHFGFWFAGDRMANGMVESDLCRWNHDIAGISKACNLLRDTESKLLITLPAGPFMNFEETGEPFLRGYDWRRQKIIHNVVEKLSCGICDEKFYYSSDFFNWEEVGEQINNPKNYHLYNLSSPNVIWCFTVVKK